MHGFRAEETTTTTGAGNLTLAGAAANCVTLNAMFNTNSKFRYEIEDETNVVWERGIGYLSGTTTLVRETVLSNSSGTTSALNLAAGTKKIYAVDDQASFVPGMDFIYAGQKYIMPSNCRSFSATNVLAANIIYVRPFIIPNDTIPGKVTSFHFNITATGTATKARIGLWGKNTSGQPGVLVQQSTDFAVGTTGVKTYSFTALTIPPGRYYVGIVTDGSLTITADGTSTTAPNDSFGAFNEPNWAAWLECSIAASWTTLADTPTISDLRRHGYGAAPLMWIGLT